MIDTMQISFFELACEKKVKEIKPLLSSGQKVFLVNYDIVREGIVESSWVCGKDTETPYYGYSVKIKGLFDVVWDVNVDNSVFTDFAMAQLQANKNAQTVVKITPDEMNLHDCRAFEYIRSIDEYKLSAVVAKEGELDFMNHLFIVIIFLRLLKR